ncbi:MAG: immunoglobulin domain-containing protein [Holophagaceae bacterium]|nr:immunoglobulin domain-containing protein [Holophagaceae bacterium]
MTIAVWRSRQSTQLNLGSVNDPDQGGSMRKSIHLAGRKIFFLGTLGILSSLGIQVGCSGSSSAIQPAPLITLTVQGPATLQTGQSATYAATVTGTSNTSVQWGSSNGAITQGGTFTAPAQAGTSIITAISQADSSKSSTIVVQVTQANRPPEVPVINGPVTVTVGVAAQFTLQSTDPDGGAITFSCSSPGASVQGSNLTLIAPASYSGSTLTLLVIASDNKGSISAAGMKTVQVLSAVAAPMITKQPLTQSAIEGANVSFTVEATGTGPLSYQWLRNGGQISGATAMTLNLSSVALSDNQAHFSVRVTNAGGSTLSQDAVLAVQAIIGAQWQLVSGSAPARIFHRSILLQDGRVLILGGQKIWSAFDPNAPASYETSMVVFNPITRTYAIVGSMPRLMDGSYSLVLGLNGKVYLFGGHGPDADASLGRDVLEIDPVTFTVTTMGQLGVKRLGPIAMLLPSGRILVAGGWPSAMSGTNANLSFEVFDPVSHSVTSIGVLPFPIYNQEAINSAVRLTDGRILMVANDVQPIKRSAPINSDKTLLFAESGSSVQVSFGPTLSAPRRYTNAIKLMNGQVVVAGGRDAGGSPVATVDVFDAAATNRTATWAMGTPRSSALLAPLPGGWLLVTGGLDFSGNIGFSSSALLNVQNGSLFVSSSMHNVRAATELIILSDGKPFIFSGIDNADALISTGEIFE